YIPWAEAHGYGRTSLRESQCTRGDLCRNVWRDARGPKTDFAPSGLLDANDPKPKSHWKSLLRQERGGNA
ncbi:MAG: hypothetical protein ACREH8_00525, partial [Opitutaceae bacterium]